jgi:methionyl-tRNA formyltransferase
VIATKYHLPVYQPEKVRHRDCVRVLKNLQPTVIVVVAFGQILPRSVLEFPPRGCINVHPSLLPTYRGAAPIQWALIHGEVETGITIMLLDEGEDTGDIIRQERVKIEPQDTATTLSDRLARLAPPLLIGALDSGSEGPPPPADPQNHAEATYAPRLTKEMGQINWEGSATQIHNLVRGTSIWPGAYTYFGDSLRLKVINCVVVAPPPPAGETKDNPLVPPVNGGGPNSENFPAGTIQITADRELIVLTGRKALQLDRVQPANKNEMTARDFLNGYRLKTGERFFSLD